VTEEEAKTRWCHRTLAALAVVEVGSFFHRAKCLGSDCMAWRWDQDEDGERHMDGHCGLAGRAA
jgi:hypothetical protein